MITKGPIIKAQLYLLVGTLLWVRHVMLIGSFNSISAGAGILAILCISTSVCKYQNSRSKDRSGDKVDL